MRNAVNRQRVWAQADVVRSPKKGGQDPMQLESAYGHERVLVFWQSLHSHSYHLVLLSYGMH